MADPCLAQDTRRDLAKAAIALGPDASARALHESLIQDALHASLYPDTSHGRIARARDLSLLRQGRLDDIAALA